MKTPLLFSLAVALSLVACGPQNTEEQQKKPTATPQNAADQAEAAAAVHAQLLAQPQSLAGSWLAGRAAANANNWDAASHYFASAYGFDPNNALLFEQALTALINNGQVAEARQLVKLVRDEAAAQKIAPNFSPATAQIMVLLDVLQAVQTKDWVAAQKALPQYLDQGFGQYLKPFLQAWVSVGQGHADTAEKILQASLQSKPILRNLYHIHLALLAENMGRHKVAEKFYNNALQSNLSIRSVWLAAEFYLRQNQPQKAIKLVKALQANLPGSPLPPVYLDYLKTANPKAVQATAPQPLEGLTAVLFDLASVLQQEQSGRVALLYAQLARSLNPDDAFVQILTGDLLATDKFFDKAQTYYQAVPKTHPLWVLAQLRAAQTLEEAGKVNAAITVLENLATMPHIAPAMHEQMGDVWRRAEKFEQALPHYDRAIAAINKPSEADWPVFFARGMCYERLKNWAKAEPDLQQALDLDPENPQILNYLGYSWADQGHNLNKAHDLVAQALEQAPNDAYIMDSMGWVLYKMGKFKAAVRYLEQAASELADDPVINDHLGDAYWQAGRQSEARVQWQRAIDQAEGAEDQELKKQLQDKLMNGLKP